MISLNFNIYFGLVWPRNTVKIFSKHCLLLFYWCKVIFTCNHDIPVCKVISYKMDGQQSWGNFHLHHYQYAPSILSKG